MTGPTAKAVASDHVWTSHRGTRNASSDMHSVAKTSNLRSMYVHIKKHSSTFSY